LLLIYGVCDKILALNIMFTYGADFNEGRKS